VCMCVCAHARVYACACTHERLFTHVCVCVCVCVSLSLSLCVCVCLSLSLCAGGARYTSGPESLAVLGSCHASQSAPSVSPRTWPRKRLTYTAASPTCLSLGRPRCAWAGGPVRYHAHPHDDGRGRASRQSLLEHSGAIKERRLGRRNARALLLRPPRTSARARHPAAWAVRARRASMKRVSAHTRPCQAADMCMLALGLHGDVVGPASSCRRCPCCFLLLVRTCTRARATRPVPRQPAYQA
jgi:hypothetical protein